MKTKTKMTTQEKAKELLKKYKFKFLAKMYCSFYVLITGSTYLKCVKNEISNLN